MSETVFPCTHCGHDISDHLPSQYGKDVCMGITRHNRICTDCNGHRCYCDGFTILVARDGKPTEEKIL
jgi:hypothetical protein